METIKIEDLKLWEVFQWVARKRNFTEAGKVLGLQTAQVSKRIGLLESRLGARLFARTTRTVSLTPDGVDLLPGAEALLEAAGALEDRLDAETRPLEGLIRVACLPSFVSRCLAPSLVAFQRKYSAVQVELEVSESLVDLVDERIDVAIRVQEPEGAQFVFRKLLDNEIILCASPAYLKRAGGPPRNLTELEKHPLLALEVFEDLRFLREGRRLGTLKSPRPFRCASGSVLTDLVLQGAGVGVRSSWDVRPLIRTGELVRVMKGSPLESFGNLYAVTPHRKLISRRVRAFLDFLSGEAKGPWSLSR